jgi:PAS domain S-box-containing protein
MSPNKKVILIVVLGVGACLVSFLFSQYFLKKEQANQLALSKIQQATARIEHIRFLGKDFIQNADQINWKEILEQMASVRLNLEATLSTRKPWGREIENLNRLLDTYEGLLSRMHDPAISLKAQKTALQRIGLSFSREIEEKIITPYRKEEGLRIYEGGSIDPFKARVKDTAYDLNALHIKQQLILLELLLSSDLEDYKKKKLALSDALARHNAQLRYMSVLIGDSPDIQSTILSLNRKLIDLVGHERKIIEYFTVLSTLDEHLSVAGEQLLTASQGFSERIVSDIVHTNRLIRTLNWSLLFGILGVLSVLGAMLARDIIHFVRDLKQTQRELRESEKNLMVTLYSIGDAVITTDAAGIITRMNPTAESLTGWPFSEAQGKPLPEVFDIINGYTRKEIPNPVEKVLAKGEIVGLAKHTILLARDGNEYQISDSGAPIRHEDGRITGVVLVFRDVTEAYAQEQKIRKNERMLKNITANVPGVVFQFESTADYGYLHGFISEKASEVFGLDVSAEGLFTQFLAHIPEDEKDRFVSSVTEAVGHVKNWHYEGRFIKPSGELMWFSGRSIPHQEDGHIIFYGVLMDITSRKQWESALAASERRYKELFNEAPIMYVITENRDGKPFIRDINNTFLTVLGYNRDDVLDAPLTGYYTENSKKELLFKGGYERALKGEFTSEERSFLTRNGETVHTLLHAQPEFDPEGRVIGTRAMFLDITGRKRAEEETKRLEIALSQAQKMEAIGTLAGGIAHDFNNILFAIVGYSDLALADTKKDTQLYKNLQQIRVAANRATDLVGQILTFSRRSDSELKPVQIGPLVKEALKLLRSSLPTTIDIVQKISDRVDNVMANPTQIHQIIMNLCTNASQSMAREGGRLTVGLSQIELTAGDTRLNPGLSPGRYVKIQVQDTGAGISENIQEKIFDPYFTTKEPGKGTGLGLSVIHGIVEGYGSAISVCSELGHGAAFDIYIPTIKNSLLKEEKQNTELPKGKETILFVDDEPILVEVGKQMLEMLGYHVKTSIGSLEALEIFLNHPEEIDLVISDMTMPNLTGDKLAVRLLRERKDLPIILCSGFINRLSKQKASEIGVKAFAVKPLDLENLAFLVRKVLDDGKIN